MFPKKAKREDIIRKSINFSSPQNKRNTERKEEHNHQKYQYYKTTHA